LAHGKNQEELKPLENAKVEELLELEESGNPVLFLQKAEKLFSQSEANGPVFFFLFLKKC